MKVTKRRLFFGALLAIGGIVSFGSSLFGGTVFRYDRFFGETLQRPYPTEMLLEIKRVSAMKTRKPLLKTESIVTVDYTKEVEAWDTRASKRLTFRMTDDDFRYAGTPKAGDLYAAFGTSPEVGKLFHLKRYEGTREKAAIDQWFATLAGPPPLDQR